MHYLINLIYIKEYYLALKKKNSKFKHNHFACQAEKARKHFIWEYSKWTQQKWTINQDSK